MSISIKKFEMKLLILKKIHLILGNLAPYHDSEIMRRYLFKIERIYTSGEHHDEKRPVVVNKLYALCLRGMLMYEMALALYREERIYIYISLYMITLLFFPVLEAIDWHYRRWLIRENDLGNIKSMLLIFLHTWGVVRSWKQRRFSNVLLF